MDVKETKELIAGLKEAFKAGKSIRDILKDGVEASDLPKVFELVKEQASKAEIYTDAIKDVSSIKDELKDLSKDEVIELFMELASAVSEVEKA